MHFKTSSAKTILSREDELTHGGLVTPYDDIDLEKTLVEVMACSLTAPCWLIISGIFYDPPGPLFTNMV